MKRIWITVLAALLLLLFDLPLGFVVVTAHVYTHENVASLSFDTIQGYGIDDTTVDEHHVIALHRFVEGR